MYLKRLEMQGFKSFADKTVLELRKGITTVIGPNGSGKSNLSDAIRWVLGEQSMKSLRGTKSLDVIFAGTQNRKSLGFAEASLVFDNSDKNKLLKSYSNIINVIKQKKTIEKVTVADEHNLDIYTAIIIMNEDIKGFSTNFAVAIDDKNFNALDNSLKYLSKMVDTMNNMDEEIKAQGF